MNLLKVANYIFSFYFLNITFKNNYHETYNNFLINISYYCIYCFSKVQMKVIQTSKFIEENINVIENLGLTVLSKIIPSKKDGKKKKQSKRKSIRKSKRKL